MFLTFTFFLEDFNLHLKYFFKTFLTKVTTYLLRWRSDQKWGLAPDTRKRQRRLSCVTYSQIKLSKLLRHYQKVIKDGLTHV